MDTKQYPKTSKRKQLDLVHQAVERTDVPSTSIFTNGFGSSILQTKEQPDHGHTFPMNQGILGAHVNNGILGADHVNSFGASYNYLADLSHRGKPPAFLIL